MVKRIAWTSLGLLVLIGGIGGVKALQIRRMIDHERQFRPSPETVTTAVVREQTWESRLSAVASLEAVQGVTVSAELTGKVVEIAFEPGVKVEPGALLLRQDTSSEEALLPGAVASVDLARLNLERARELWTQRVSSQQQLDTAEANFKRALADAEEIRSAIQKKTIRAPFAGQLGIRLVNLGQMLEEGDPIVSLQALDPIFVNFTLPQQELYRIEVGFPVRVRTDALPEDRFEGRITAIEPEVDSNTRNFRLQATLANPDEKLRPGMFASAAVVLPAQAEVLVVPATAVLYAPYSDSVFVLDEDEGVVHQRLIRLGERRGDFVAVRSGLEKGEQIVSTGAFKLRNGQKVVIDNALAPDFQLAPQPPNE